MNYEECLAYIHSVKWRGSKPGLSRTRELLGRLGNPEKKLKFVHIAGTNGKGSCAAAIASILRASGYNTGLFTSPYLFRFNERMQIDGEQIPDDELCYLTEKIRPFADSMEDVPTEFEMITAIGMEFFAAHSSTANFPLMSVAVVITASPSSLSARRSDMRLAPPMCPESTGITCCPSSSMTMIAGSVTFDLRYGAKCLNAIPTDPTDTMRSFESKYPP